MVLDYAVLLHMRCYNQLDAARQSFRIVFLAVFGLLVALVIVLWTFSYDDVERNKIQNETNW